MSGNRMRTFDPTKLPPGYSIAEDSGVSKAPARGGSKAEESLAFAIKYDGVPEPRREYRFMDTRRWRFDFAWPALMFAVEVEGITHDHGRHQRKDGFEQDLAKYEAALLGGWVVYRCSPAMVKSGKALSTIKEIIDRLKQNHQQKHW